MNAFLLKVRNRILYHLALSGRDEIEGINTSEHWDAAGYDSILFHAIMKWPLREIIRVLPDIPEKWIDDLNGSRKLMYQIGKECWYDVDGNAERKQKLWKPFLYFLVLWQNDEVLEPADRMLYEILKRRDQFYINLGNLDPINWYMDSNPRLADNKAGRCGCIFSEDPEIRYDSMTQRSIVLANPPRRNFFTIRNQDGTTGYLLFNRHAPTRESDGGYRYAVLSDTNDLLTAALEGHKIEQGEL